ncbi:hypothetical protein V1477_020812 [Vespula maculifrons]|uniref:Uncharacterized protein n=1 Tax=Vespula maculifrons TaxID=7453 RepID=A0ABD2AN03_VESMC
MSGPLNNGRVWITELTSIATEDRDFVELLSRSDRESSNSSSNSSSSNSSRSLTTVIQESYGKNLDEFQDIRDKDEDISETGGANSPNQAPPPYLLLLLLSSTDVRTLDPRH